MVFLPIYITLLCSTVRFIIPCLYIIIVRYTVYLLGIMKRAVLLFIVVVELDLLQAISVPFDDPKHVYFAEGLHGLHAFGLRAGAHQPACIH